MEFNWSFMWGFVAGAFSVLVVGIWHIAGQITEREKIKTWKGDDEET